MTLPHAVVRHLLERFGAVSDVRAVPGGSICDAYALTLAGQPAFLKLRRQAPAGFFTAEARGLNALRAVAGGPRVPATLAVCDAAPAEGGAEPSWLLLEWLAPAAPTSGYAERLGRGLAALHRSHARDHTGWGASADGFIGPLPQANAATATWADFWRHRRLEPQLQRARAAGHAPGATADWDRLLSLLPSLLAPAGEEGPSLLHGDLWSGNILALAGGVPALVDPASYSGHREADLAMGELFGGVDSRVLAAYHEAWPLCAGYAEQRRAVYQLYYLLVHVNLFGGSYLQQTRHALRTALTAGSAGG